MESKFLNNTVLYNLGRASIRIKLSDGRNIYIDPAEGSKQDYKEPADLVLVTHQHGDHNRVELVDVKKTGTVIQCPYDISSGEAKEIDGISINAVKAYNKNHIDEQCCGYIITIKDLVIYHSGDTSTTDEMIEFLKYNIDYALLCMDGYYNMGPEEAMKAADIIDAKHVIPIHTSKSGLYDQDNVDKFTHARRLIVKVGEKVILRSN